MYRHFIEYWNSTCILSKRLFCDMIAGRKKCIQIGTDTCRKLHCVFFKSTCFETSIMLVTSKYNKKIGMALYTCSLGAYSFTLLLTSVSSQKMGRIMLLHRSCPRTKSPKDTPQVCFHQCATNTNLQL